MLPTSSTPKQMVVEPPGGAEDPVMRSDRVLGKIEMFVNDWLVQLGQGINPQWFISTKKGDGGTWKEGKMHGLSTKGISSKVGSETSEQSARIESQNRRSTSIICNMAYSASLLNSGITATQREVYYANASWFKSWPESKRGDGQLRSNQAILDLAAMLGEKRHCLNIVAGSRGHIAGRLRVKQRGGEWTDPRNMLEGSINVSSEWLHEEIMVETDARFILVVEKETVFKRLLENQFFNKLPCIIVTGMGQPSEATRAMVNGLQITFSIPVYGAFDCGPYGLSIFLSYVAALKANTDCSPNQMRWLGIRPLQLESLNFTPAMFQSFTQADHSCAKGLSNHPYVLKQPGFLQEVEVWLLENPVKVELEGLHSLGPNILSSFLAESVLQANYI
eukprot:292656_1